jgi:cation:H+ antiporter
VDTSVGAQNGRTKRHRNGAALFGLIFECKALYFQSIFRASSNRGLNGAAMARLLLESGMKRPNGIAGRRTNACRSPTTERRTHMLLNLILFAVGLAMLYYGAEWLVKGSSSLARSLGVAPIVIGLTVVAFGTSAPELVVSVISSVKDKSMIAVGNVIGSNICNIALVLGLAALFQPITSDRSVVRRDIPIMLAVSVYLVLLSANSLLGRFEGFTLFVGIVLYTWFNYSATTKVKGPTPSKPVAGYGGLSVVGGSGAAVLSEMRILTETVETPVAVNVAPSADVAAAEALVAEASAMAELEDIGYDESRSKQNVLVGAGIAGVVIGAEVLIDAAVKIMSVLGVSEKFIGLTIVAFGTSLPELATSVVAAVRKEMDISIGNLVGSNVFNILMVLGAASLVRPIPIPGGFMESGLYIDYIVMIVTSALPWLFLWKRDTIERKDGAILLACYLGYLVYLVMKS